MSRHPDNRRPRRIERRGFCGIRLKNHSDAKGSLAFMSMIDMVRGRTAIRCTTLATDFDEALPQFRAIRGSITFPE